MATYPQTKDEADKFASGIIKLIHNQKTQPEIVKQLQDDRAPIALRLGGVASKIIMRMIMLVQQQAGGRKPNFQMLVQAINMTIKELAQICKIVGIEVTPKDMADAAKICGDLVEGGFSGKQQNPQMPQQGQIPGGVSPSQRQGLIGGVQ